MISVNLRFPIDLSWAVLRDPLDHRTKDPPGLSSAGTPSFECEALNFEPQLHPDCLSGPSSFHFYAHLKFNSLAASTRILVKNFIVSL